MLKVVLKRLKTQSEEVIAMEYSLASKPQRALQSSPLISESYVNGSFNISEICFMSSWIFKRPLTVYGMQTSWNTMYHISVNLFYVIEQLYGKATNAVKICGSPGEYFRTKVGVRQSCLL